MHGRSGEGLVGRGGARACSGPAAQPWGWLCTATNLSPVCGIVASGRVCVVWLEVSVPGCPTKELRDAHAQLKTARIS